MPLNATFLADFSSFLDATRKSVDATHELTESAKTVGPAFDQTAASASKAAETTTTSVTEHRAQLMESAKAVGEHLREVSNTVVEFAGKYIEAFTESERSTTRLNQALINAGQTAETTKTYEELAKSLAHVSTFSKDAIINVETLLTTVGNVKPDNMEAALKATMDLAAGMAGQGMSLETAAKLVAKAAASDGEALGKLKLILGDAMEKGSGFDGVIQAINEKFGGTAQADLKTYGGQMENLKNQWTEMQVTIGEKLVPTLTKLMETFQQLPDGVKEFAVAVVSIGTAVSPVLQAIAALIEVLGAAGLGAAFGGAALAVAGFLPEIKLLMDAWGKMLAYIKAQNLDLSTALKQAIDNITGFFTGIPTALANVIKAVAAWYVEMKNWLYDKMSVLLNQTVALVGDAARSIIAIFQTMYRTLIGGSIIPDLMEGISAQFGALPRIMVDPAHAATNAVVADFARIGMPQPGSFSPGAATLNPAAWGANAGGPPVSVTVNMTGMFGSDDPKSLSLVTDLVSKALMQSMRNTRLLGTA